MVYVGFVDLQEKIIKKTSKHILKQNWGNMKAVLPVSSGGLHPRLVPDVINLLGRNVVVQAGGGIHGHPNGTRVGAAALLQAVEAVNVGMNLHEYAKTHKELEIALRYWGNVKPV